MAEKENYGIQNEHYVQQCVADCGFFVDWGHGRGESCSALALPRARCFTRSCAQASFTFRTQRFLGGIVSRGWSAPTGAAAGLFRKCAPRRRPGALLLQSPQGRARTLARDFRMRRFTFAQIALRLGADFRRALGRRRQIDSGAARLRQANGDRLLHTRGAVHALPHVIDLFTHELACLRRGRLPLASILARAFQGLLIVRRRHREYSRTGGVIACEKCGEERLETGPALMPCSRKTPGSRSSPSPLIVPRRADRRNTD